ncbi:transposase [Nonomuraea sp. NPDC023979]|uniref:transposase n=1 Tax=Nonomuraea sp. NPDC023979 TaxID=3154796 RepID=UPI0033F4EB00
MAVWRGPDGILIEPIVLEQRPCLRVTQDVNGRRYLLGYCTSVKQVARHVDLADLVEVIPLRAHRSAL